MDIIDIMLAKALTPQGKVESFARQSQATVARANQAVAAIDSITEQTNTNNAKSEETLAAAEQALENASDAESRIAAALESIQGSSVEQIDNEIDKLALSLAATANGSKLTLTTPSGAKKSVEGWNIPQQTLYSATGSHTDGAMTQKAITDALTSLDNKIKAGGSGASGVSNLGIDAAGHIVIVGPDGTITAGEMTEAAILQALIKSGTYTAEGTVGITVDYENKSSERIQDATRLRAGHDFDTYTMYGGRKRCNVADDGTITAFYGDSNYKEDGSNGQVMVYQPKFYYQRSFLKEVPSGRGTIIRKESLLLSDTARVGFKLHPLFAMPNGEELDYVLLPAFEGSIFDVSENAYLKNNETTVDFSSDKISSVTGAKPFNGSKMQLNLEKMSQMARNRGEGWQLTTLESESALQMLGMVEFGTPNGQVGFEKGIVNIERNNAVDCSAIIGSTSYLGNDSGAATSTIIDRDGSQTTYTVAGSRAISYRGMENPWGSLWRVVGNANVRGNSSTLGGVVYVSDNSLIINLPSSSAAWVSAMGYQDANYDWAYLPIECASSANSAVPIGDALWTTPSLNGTNLLAVGGSMNASDNAGPFHYSADMGINTNVRYFNGRIMYVPNKNSIYEANIAKWRAHM